MILCLGKIVLVGRSSPQLLSSPSSIWTDNPPEKGIFIRSIKIASSPAACISIVMEGPLKKEKPESPKTEWETKTNYNAESCKIAIIMVGLPARGKSFIARNLARYLCWIGVKTAVVSLSHLRKSIVGDQVMAEFFNPANKEALDKRTDVADKALNDLIKGFDSGGAQVGILDASNTTEARREYIQTVLQELSIKVIFVECLFNDKEDDDFNDIHVHELRLTCPEYDKLSDDQAIEDFKLRIQYYRPDYVKMDAGQNQTLSYIQFMDGGSRIVVNQVTGFLPTKILFYLMNLRHANRSIYLSQGTALNEQLMEAICKGPIQIWSDIRSPDHFKGKLVRFRATLRQLDLGLVESLGEDQIKEQYPEEYKRHCLDPYHHRYPRSESYHDLVVRLESIIMELERDSSNILVIADASVIRCIYAYYIEATPFIIPSLVLDPSELIQLQPEAYGCHETRYDTVSGHNSSPKIFRKYL